MISDKDSGNRYNLNHGLAFAYRAGDLAEKAVGNAIAGTHLKAPVLAGRPRAGTWYRVPIPEGVSGDGSGYYIYIRKGKTKNLCIFFSGGGMAWNEYTAARPVSGGKLAAGMPNYYWNNLRPFTQIMNIRTGITDTANPLNPFRDWNFVIITYATGDLHVGDSVFPYTAEDGSRKAVCFHGHRNFEAAMRRSEEYFRAPERLLIAGDSAGAFAVPALTGEILSRSYPDCRDVTVFSDSGQLLYPHWRRTARDVWKTEERLWKTIRTPNITLDWYRSLYAEYGDRLRYLYASSIRDYLLSAYYNDITRKKYQTDAEVQEEFFRQLKSSLEMFRGLIPKCGIFLNDWKNLTVYPGLRGGTVHTAVRQRSFFLVTPAGDSMAHWLNSAVNGQVYDRGTELLAL